MRRLSDFFRRLLLRIRRQAACIHLADLKATRADLLSDLEELREDEETIPVIRKNILQELRDVDRQIRVAEGLHRLLDTEIERPAARLRGAA